ncbi:hypothetical protein [Pseudonocardia pini]|uniref:hypothetical protein n=1 Tax=Pseudonocardia pini TaxID=2758030 RepID=UPI0015F017A3|nr:hypothetical protein [Pseudonocardia pini]
MKISFHTGLLDDLGVDEAVRTILDAGYDEVELNAETLPWSRRHVSPSTSAEQRRRLAATGAVCSVCAHYEGLSSRDPQLRRMAVEVAISRWTVARACPSSKG